MINRGDYEQMSAFEKQALKDLRAIALWSLVTATLPFLSLSFF
jgi:hypothetical protein